MAVDAIHRVGPNGHYLKDEHNMRHYKSEYWLPYLVDRRSYEDWELMGKKSFKDLTAVRVQDILSTFEQVYIKPETEELIKKVLTETEEWFK